MIVDRPDPKSGQLQFEPDYFFLVINWRKEERTGLQVLEHYRGRGTFEVRLGEFRAAVRSSLSSPNFRENEALLLLSLAAYNLASLLRDGATLLHPHAAHNSALGERGLFAPKL